MVSKGGNPGIPSVSAAAWTADGEIHPVQAEDTTARKNMGNKNLTKP